MKTFALKMVVVLVRLVSALMSVFVRPDGSILLISGQGDRPTQDMLDLALALRALPGAPRVVLMAGLMRRSFFGAFAFTFTFFSMLWRVMAAKTVVLDAYCPAVSIPKRCAARKVVQLWHAPDAIKKFSLQIVDTPAGYSSKTARILNMHQGYDYILCPSVAARPFFAEAFGYPENVFVKHAQPVFDRIGALRRPAHGAAESPAREAARERIFARYPQLVPGALPRGEGKPGGSPSAERPLVVVYAPTFRDGEAVRTGELACAFERAVSQASPARPVFLVLKLHPLDAVKRGRAEPLSDDRTALDTPNDSGANGDFCAFADTEFPLLDWYAVSDAIITDYSGAAVEAAAADLASYYYIYDQEAYAARRGLNVDLRGEATGAYAFADADALAARLLFDFADPADAEGRYDREALAAFACKYLETPLHGNTRRLAAFLADL